ncbi:MAG: chromate transporter [Muribaculaceae bacterium]
MIYLKLIGTYLLIGLFGFGGGYAMLALIERMIVGPGWITEQTFTDIVAISQMTPGPIGINSATYIGYVAPQMNGYPHWWWGVLGSIACTVTIIIPSFVLVRRTSHFIARHRESQYIRGAFAGLRPVVVGLIASAALLLMNSANFGSTTRDVCISVAICVATLLIQLFTKLHPIVTICLAGLAGWLIF